MSPRRWPPTLWALLAAAFLLRALALAATAGIPCFQDECSYVSLARSLAQGRGFLPHAKHLWPPGYIFFLAAHLAAGWGLLAAKASQVILSTLLVPLVFVVGARAARSGGEADRASRVGLIAAGLVAFDPTLIAYSHYFWSETLFLPLLTGALLAVLACAETASVANGVLAGAMLGAACLVKVVPLYLSPLLAGAIWLRANAPFRARLRAAATLIAAMLSVIAPWTVRNALVYHHFVLVEATAGKNLVRGNSAYPPTNWDWGSRRATPALDESGCDQHDLVDLDRCLRRRGLEEIAGHPLRFLRQGATKIADLVNPTSFLVRHVRVGLYGEWPRPLADALVVFVALFSAAVMALAAVGWVTAPASPVRLVAGLATGYTVALHVITFGMSRFRLPLVPLLAVGSALALTRATRLDFRGNRLRAWAAAAILAALVACWSVRIGDLFHEMKPGELPPSLDPGRQGPEG